MAPAALLYAAEQKMARWRRHLISAAQDAYVEAWQSAWTAGCAAGWHGQPLRAPHRHGALSDAWHAGWNWAHTQPNRRKNRRRNPSWVTHRNVERRALRRVAIGQLFGLAVIAIVRWLLQRRPATSGPQR
jgi:hypothetical protein